MSREGGGGRGDEEKEGNKHSNKIQRTSKRKSSQTD